MSVRAPERIVTQRMAETVGRALDLIPPLVLERLGGVPPFFEGNINFAGVSGLNPEWAWCHWSKGDYWITPWVSLPWVRPSAWYPAGFPDVGTVLHEIGHVLHAKWLRPASRHRRVWWSHSRQEVRAAYGHTGLIPPMRWSIARHGDPLQEGFAEAFRVYLSPPELLCPWDDIGRFYANDPRYSRNDDWGDRLDNRYLLAMLNELSGLPADTPPAALR